MSGRDEPPRPGAERTGAWYRKLVEEGTDITLVVDADGTMTYVSQAMERILGYPPSDLLGDDLWSVAHPEDSHALVEAIANLRTGRATTETVEVRCRRADGTLSWLAATMRSRLEDEIGGIVVTGRDITDQKARETELRTTKERMKMALEGANLGIWDWDIDTDEVRRDELLIEMLGYTPAEMGEHLDDWERVVHPEGQRRHDAALADHIEDRTPYYQCEYRLETKSGDWKWVRTMGTVVERDASGEPLRAVGIHQDIDDRKRAELSLESERDMFKQGPAVVFKWQDRTGRPVTYVSENVESVFGYTADALQSSATRYADLVHADDTDRIDREMAAYDDEETRYFNPEPYRVRTADDDVRWVMEYTKTLREDGDGSTLLGYIVDITERKQRERELEAREAKYRNLFAETRDALMLLDRDGFFDCNERALELFRVDTVDAFTDYSPWDLSPSTQPDGSDSTRKGPDHVETAFEEGEAFFEWTHQRADGTEFPAEVKLSRFEHQGEPALHALVRDISERKAQERRIEEQRDNLDVLNQVLSHDIRNDVQSIMAYADVLETECDNDALHEYIDIILESAENAVTLTTSAREIADVMLSTEEELTPVDLKTVLEDEIEEVRSANPDAEIAGESTVPAVSVQADEMLGSIFRNLLNNAIQHNDAGTPKVVVSARTREDTVTVRVADNGPGVPDAQKASIFGKGEKGLESQGTGIGLYLVKTIVESYDGDVRVADRAGRSGSRPQAGEGATHQLADDGSETDASPAPSPTDPHSIFDDDATGTVFVVELPKVARA